MKILYNKVFLAHQTGMHSESSKRFGLLADVPESDILNGEAFLELVHKKEYIEQVRTSCKQGIPLDRDTPCSPGSYEAAIYAAGATIMASESNDFALVRPPGHHAYPARASGFCLFNNIAIASRKLANEGKRVLLLDFDGHLGDGTSEIFYDSDQVLYWSIHQYPAFPGHGFTDEIGTGAGEGYTINVPLPPDSGDDIFMDAVRTFLPIVKKFDPDVVAVSAGFDGHQYDLLLNLKYSLNSFYRIGKILGDSFERIFATLEGGYNIEYLPKCVENFIAGINRQEMPHKEKETESGIQVWQLYEAWANTVLTNLDKHWNITS